MAVKAYLLCSSDTCWNKSLAACLSKKFCNQNEVELFDSAMRDPPDVSIILQACAILRSEGKSMTLNVIDTQQLVIVGFLPLLMPLTCVLMPIPSLSIKVIYRIVLPN